LSACSDGHHLAMIPTQEIAAEILEIVDRKIISAKEALRIGLSGKNLDYKVRGSIHAYVMETLKRRNAIDFLINLCLENKNVQNLKPFIRNLLRIAVYEMLYKDVHPALATDAAVRIAKRRIGERAAALVNAVMRKAEEVDINAEVSKMNEIERLSLRYFHPEWFVRYTIELLGKDQAIELMIANMQSTTYVRVNELKASIESVRRYLEKHCLVEETPLPEVFKIVAWKKHPSTLDWHESRYVVQDLASSLVAHILKPEQGERILDLAAAPGQKTSHIAMLMENKGKIVAVDNSEERVKRMKAKLKRLGVEIVDCRVADGVKFSWKADKVLIDPPCSSTGALRNYPCVKWRFDWKKYNATIKLQRKMLENAYRNLESGGVAVYSTCSIAFEENEENVMSSKFRVDDANMGYFSTGISEFRGKRFSEWEKVVRTWPHIHDCCGFFIARLQKE